MTRVGFDHFTSFILPLHGIRSPLIDNSIHYSEIMWSSPWSSTYYVGFDVIKHTGGKPLPRIMVIQGVVFAILATAIYFKPKWGAALTLATLAPKICHRLTEIPKQPALQLGK